MRKVSQSKYLENSNICPVCGSNNLDGDSIEVDYHIAWQNIWCVSCGFSWTDEYTLTGMSEPCNIETDEEYELVD
jgi:C4-type Zn-finger protein